MTKIFIGWLAASLALAGGLLILGVETPVRIGVTTVYTLIAAPVAYRQYVAARAGARRGRP